MIYPAVPGVKGDEAREVSAGAEAGFEAGQIAMVLTSDRGVRAFESGNNFTLNADAGFTIIDWSAQRLMHRTGRSRLASRGPGARFRLGGTARRGRATGSAECAILQQ